MKKYLVEAMIRLDKSVPTWEFVAVYQGDDLEAAKAAQARQPQSRLFVRWKDTYISAESARIKDISQA